MTNTALRMQSRMQVGRFTGTLLTATPRGHIDTIHGLPSYITRGTARSNSTIIFLTESSGFHRVNNKLLADQYATQTGLRVLMPNVLPGGEVPVVMMDLPRPTRAGVAWWKLQGQAKRAWAVVRKMALLIPFGSRVKRLYPVILRYIRAVKAALPLGSRLGIAGFCLGGHWSSRACGEAAADGGDSPLIDAQFTAHPSSVRAEELFEYAAKFHVPFSLALGDQDRILPLAEARQMARGLQGVFRDEPDKLQVVMYRGCGHGFALKADPRATEENDGAERALEQAVAWFRRYL